MVVGLVTLTFFSWTGLHVQIHLKDQQDSQTSWDDIKGNIPGSAIDYPTAVGFNSLMVY